MAWANAHYRVKTEGAMFRDNFILIGLLGIFSVQTSEAADDFTAAGVTEFTAAYQAWDGERFATAAELFRRATTNEPTNVMNFYWLGTAQFHRGLQLQSTHPDSESEVTAEAALDAAVDALEIAVELDQRHAESHALLGTIYGMKINDSLLRKIRFGPKVAKHQELALKYGASDPRVQYLLGMCLFHTAKEREDWQTALQVLLRAEELFEKESKAPAAPLAPRWGHDSCLTFLGRTYENLGDMTNAEAYFRKALARHPQDSVAQEGLKRVSEKK